MNTTAPAQLPPRAFKLAQSLVLLAASITVLASPEQWHARYWVAPLIPAAIGVELILWPRALGDIFGARVFGIVMVGLSLATLLHLI